MLRVVAAIALPCTRIDSRDKCIRIEPLNRARLGSGKVAMAAVGIHSRHKTRELRSTSLHNASTRRAHDRERNPAMPKHGSGNLPAVERLRQQAIPNLHWQLIH